MMRLAGYAALSLLLAGVHGSPAHPGEGVDPPSEELQRLADVLMIPQRDMLCEGCMLHCKEPENYPIEEGMFEDVRATASN